MLFDKGLARARPFANRASIHMAFNIYAGQADTGQWILDSGRWTSGHLTVDTDTGEHGTTKDAVLRHICHAALQSPPERRERARRLHSRLERRIKPKIRASVS